MIRVELRQGPGTVSNEEYNQVVRALWECQKLTVGPGLEMRESTMGKALSVAPGIMRGEREPHILIPAVHGNAVVDLDEATWSTDDNPGYGVWKVELSGVAYDSVNHKLINKYHVCKYDSIGLLYDVSAEQGNDCVAFTTCDEV